MPYRVLVVDDNEDFRVWFRALLDGAPDFELAADAADGHRAVELAATHRLDIAVVDVLMPEMDGIEAARRIQVEQPSTLVVLTSASLDSARKSLAATGAGFSLIPKADLSVEELRRTLGASGNSHRPVASAGP